MPPSADRLIARLAEGRALRLWKRAADAAPTAELSSLRELRARARRTRREIDRLLAAAETRLALPHVGANAMHRPLGADWLWRPEPWRLPVQPRGQAGLEPGTVFAPGVTLFHDCPLREIALRQDRTTRAGDLAPFGLLIEVLGFRGSFLSLALDLPEGAVEGLQRRHVFSLALEAEAERPVVFMARLNIAHGPNTEQIAMTLPAGRGVMTEFDLGHSQVNEKRVEKIWLDLIIADPANNAIRLGDLTMSRRPRAVF
ncbi:MAG: hypothetical protein IT562_12605 [Alphaproteobacteria bacterium]|nr:hypothetical protein [Alphaproteobacteria bacterium]